MRTSRSTSTCRGIPWVAWTWTEVSAVVRRRAARVSRSGTVSVRMSCWSQPRRVSGSGAGRESRCAAAELARIDSERCISRTSRPSAAESGWRTASTAVSSRRLTGPSATVAASDGPAGGGGHRQPEMDLANLRDRSHQLELGDRQPGVAEQRQPVRQGERRSGSDRRDRGAVPLHRRGRVDLRGDPTPQLRLPRQVRVDVAAGPVAVPARRPVLEHPRPVPRIPREEPGDPAGDGPPAFLPQLVRVALVTLPEVPGERVAPRLVEARVDDREHPPDQPFGVPRVGVVGVGEQPDERGRAHEVDTRAYPVAVLVRPEPVREPLGQPALDALGGHHDELAGEHPADRLSQELTELVGEQVRARVDVHGQPHGSTVCVRSDDQGRWSSATKRMVWRPSTAAMLLELDLPIFRPGLRPRVGLKSARPCGCRRL